MKLPATLPLLLVGASLFASCNPATAPAVQVADYKGADNDAALAAFARQQVAARPKQVIVYFYADWCGPCRRFRQSLADERVAKALQPATLIKLNIDNYPALATQYDVAVIPTFSES